MSARNTAIVIINFVTLCITGFILGGGWLFLSGFSAAVVLFVSLGQWVEGGRRKMLVKLMEDRLDSSMEV